MALSKCATTSLADCVDENGSVSVQKWATRSKNKRALFQNDEVDKILGLLEDDSDNVETRQKKPKQTRRRKGFFDEEKQKWVDPDPWKSKWYLDYVISNQYSRNKKLKKKFRRRFRMPRNNFLDLVKMAREENWFPEEEKPDATGRKGSPLELLMLGSLRYLGRGWTFDDLEEATDISEEKHRLFFHDFIAVGAKHMYPKWVVLPTTDEDIRDSTSEFEEAGLPGAHGSTDGTHVILEKCSARLRNQHLGAKLKFTARAFNLTVNHRRRILSTSPGCPSRWNDKSLQTFDSFLNDIRSGKLYGDRTFELYDDAGVLHTFSGAWCLAVNGYLKWSCLVPPMKDAFFYDDIRWSKWLESMRKDVECTFGILKGRWRILKTGIRIHGLANVDKIWKTCCALHNYLLEVDGLAAKWEEGVRSPYESDLGLHDDNDVPHLAAYADVVDKNGNRLFADVHDLSGMGTRSDLEEDDEDEDDDDEEDEEDEKENEVVEEAHLQPTEVVTPIRHLSLNSFRKKLITHFEYKWGLRQIIWPSRNGKGRPLNWGNNMIPVTAHDTGVVALPPQNSSSSSSTGST